MALVIETEAFIDLVDTLAATSGVDKNEVGQDGVFLYSARGAVGDEPGEKDLIAGLSTDGRVAGHYYRSCDSNAGFKPTLWPSSVFGIVASIFGSRAAESEGDHILEIRQLPDDMVEVFEYGTSGDVKVTFRVLPADGFPHAGVIRLIKGISPTSQPTDAQDVPLIDGTAELWSADTLGKLLRIAKSWKGELVLEKSSVTGAVHRASVTGITNWSGAVVPPVPEESAELNTGAWVDTFLKVK